MTKKTVHLRFPPQQAQEPIIYKLVKEYDLVVNLLRARIEPNEEGHAIIEVSGSRADVNRAVQYLKKSGVEVKSLSADIRRHDSRCIHCGVCVAVCPSNALEVIQPSGEVVFHPERCVACQGCILACAFDVMEVTV